MKNTTLISTLFAAGTLTLRGEDEQEERTHAWIGGNVKSVDLLGHTWVAISDTARTELLTLGDGAQASVYMTNGDTEFTLPLNEFSTGARWRERRLVKRGNAGMELARF